MCRQLFHRLALSFDASLHDNWLQWWYLKPVSSNPQSLHPFPEHVCRRQPHACGAPCIRIYNHSSPAVWVCRLELIDPFFVHVSRAEDGPLEIWSTEIIIPALKANRYINKCVMHINKILNQLCHLKQVHRVRPTLDWFIHSLRLKADWYSGDPERSIPCLLYTSPSPRD